MELQLQMGKSVQEIEKSFYVILRLSQIVLKNKKSVYFEQVRQNMTHFINFAVVNRKELQGPKQEELKDLLLSFAQPDKEEHKAKRVKAEKQILKKLPNFGANFIVSK